MNIHEFIAAQGLAMDAHRVPHRAKIYGHWNDGTRHYSCTITKALPPSFQRQMRVGFSQGSSHTENPTLADVLDCLAMDTSGLDGATDDRDIDEEAFVEWAGNYALDTDSREAEAIYRACIEQANELRGLLGPDALNTLIDDIERL